MTPIVNFNPWLIRQHRNGSQIASLCVGSFLLASTGLLKENHCSTHWQYANEFRAFFPGVKLTDDKIITEQHLYQWWRHFILESAFAFAGEIYGQGYCHLASKYFALDVTRHSQSPFAIFNGQKEHEDLEVRRIQEFIEQNFHERILVDDLAERFSLSRRTLERRFLKATSNSLSEYIQRVRIEAAKKELEGGRNSVQDVMYAVGYSDENAFRRLFQRVTGKSPLKYRDTYAR